MKRIINKISIFGLILLLASCYKHPNDDALTSDFDTYFTQYNPETDFGSFTTFFLNDSIAVVTNDEDITPEKVNAPSFKDPVYQKIIDNMVANGYQQVTDSNEADLVILPIIFYTDQSGVVYYPGYWGGYYPGYWWGWGYYYSFIPQYYSFQFGAFIMDIIDAKNADFGNRRAEWIWNGSVSGLPRNYDFQNNDLITNGIDRLFEMSTDYFETTK